MGRLALKRGWRRTLDVECVVEDRMHVRYLRMSHVADCCENDRELLMVVSLSGINYALCKKYATQNGFSCAGA